METSYAPEHGVANALVIFARVPVAGRVKTRLAGALGPGGAAELYAAFLRDLGRRLGRDPRWRTSWSIAPEPDVAFPSELAAGLPVERQRGVDLGERMRHALADALAGGASAAAVVGSDVPYLEPDRVAEAFAALAVGADLVLVPAEDGGYALIAARSVPDVFDGIVWGGRDVLAATLAHASRAGLRVRTLDPVYDVDRAADVSRLEADVTGGRFDGLDETAKVLRSFRRRGARSLRHK